MRNKIPLSVIFLTFNSELYIERSLLSVREWAGEILVVDSGSTDSTLEIVRKYTTQVMIHAFENYSQQRNWAQANAALSFDWIMHLDADESATAELRDALYTFFHEGSEKHINGLLVARRVVFLGRWIKHGGMYPVYHQRIYRKNIGYCEDRLYDQHFVVEGPTIKLKGDIIDYVTPDLDSWMKSHIKWAGFEMRQHFLNDSDDVKKNMVKPEISGNVIQRRRWIRTNMYNRMPLFSRSIIYFLYRYLFRLGFLDGKEGLIFHILQGFWYRFYVDAKIWEYQCNLGEQLHD